MTMATDMNALVRRAQATLAAQDEDLRAKGLRELAAVHTRSASGTSHISEKVNLSVDFRLVFIRCHFSGPAGTASFVVRIGSRLGEDFGCTLLTVTAGVGADVLAVDFAGRHDDPSPFAFAAGDELLIEWTNPSPGDMRWGLEVGLALSARPMMGL
jgi:hypothetical protein